jgi:uncharacterized membrane protein YbhN (UPF0104 family)
MKLKNSPLVKILSIFLTVLTVILSGVYFFRLIKLADITNISFNWVYLVVSVLLFACFYLLLSINWYLVSRSVSDSVKPNQMLSFFASQPYKYLPTSIFTFSFRAKYSKDLGLGVKDSSLSQLIENLILVSTAIYLSILLILIKESFLMFVTMILITFLLVAFLPNNFNFKFKSYKRSITKKILLKSFAVVCVAWVFSGCSLYYLAQSYGYNNSAVDILISNSVAYPAGIVAFFAPGGIGVRELIYDWFGVAARIIILWRILTFVMDFILGFLAIILIKTAKLK